MSTLDDQIGQNLARFRGEMSQAELATLMRSIGWKWSQATVWSIEKGERPLRLAEAEHVARILGVVPSDLLLESGSAELWAARQRIIAAKDTLGSVATRLIREQRALAKNHHEWGLDEDELTVVDSLMSIDPGEIVKAAHEWALSPEDTDG